jgi:peroxiredoxin
MRIILITIVACMLWAVGLQAQNTRAVSDSTYEEYMRDAWQEIRESDMSDSLQKKYAIEFYEYFLEEGETDTGLNAIQSAFMMWGNTGEAAYLEESISGLAYDSKAWSRIVFTFGNIFARNEELSEEKHLDLIRYLSDNLEEPRGRSEALLVFLRTNNRMDGSVEKSVEAARQLVELDATEFHVNQGLGYLHELESLNIGQEAPDFTATDLNGQEITLSELRGEYVLLEFWATWCGPCIPEIPYLKEMDEMYGESGLRIVGISIDRDEKTLREFISEREMGWPQIYVEDSWSGGINRLYNVSGIPRMYLIDPEGYIAARDLRGEEMVTTISGFLEDSLD